MRIPVDKRLGGLRPVARWLTVAAVLLILYGTLFPFRFSALGEIGFFELLRGLSFQRTSRSDVVANLLLYVPLGLCLMLSWPGRWRRSTAFGWTVAGATLLSIAVELLQVHAPSRVSSLTDVMLNATGAATGALVALLYTPFSHIRVPGIHGRQPEPTPLGVVLLWLAFRLAPFIPAWDPAKYKQALFPVIPEPQFLLTDIFRFTVGWLVVGYAVRQVWRREFAAFALAVVVALVLLGRIIVAGKTLVTPELAGLVLAAGAGALLIAAPDRRRCTILAALLAAVIVIEGLKPFVFSTSVEAFSWVPFKSPQASSLEINYSMLLEKCFWYFALVWLLARRGAGAGAAALMVLALLATIEIVQLWIPGRSSEITDPLLALAAGVLIALLGTGIYSKR